METRREHTILALLVLVFVVLAIFLSSNQNEAQLIESTHPSISAHETWWLPSGGYLHFTKDGFETIQGELVADDVLRQSYLRMNPLDTDNGYFPQNIFRLLSKSEYEDTVVTTHFKINKLNLSESPNRNESNGVLLISHYRNEDNFYYAGIQVDGRAIIRKKRLGVYETLAEIKIFDTEETYSRDETPSLLPLGEWIGLSSDTKTLENGDVLISLSVDQGEGWQKVLEGRDKREEVLRNGLYGIRSDFMDVSFRQVSATLK